MSFSNATQLVHNIRARAHERGDHEIAELAKVLEEIVEGLDSEMRDIKHALQNLESQVRNLR